METRTKPYALYGEPTAKIVEDVDEMFEILFKDLRDFADEFNEHVSSSDDTETQSVLSPVFFDIDGGSGGGGGDETFMLIGSGGGLSQANVLKLVSFRG